MYFNYLYVAFFVLLFSCSSESGDSSNYEEDKKNVTSNSVSDVAEEAKAMRGNENESSKMVSFAATDATTKDGSQEQLNYLAPEIKSPADNINYTASAVLEKKIIKNATVKFQVKELTNSSKNIEIVSKKYGAYVSASNQTNNYGSLNNSISIRVPAGKFEDLLNEVLKESIYIESKNITSQDVTEEYVDTETRIKTKKDIEQRYKEILRQAKSIDEILAVESKIAEIREEIESKEGRLKFLSDNVLYSTIQVELYQTISGEIQPENGFFSRLGRAISDGWDGLLGFFVGLIRIWPFLLICTIVILVGKRWWNRRNKKTITNL